MLVELHRLASVPFSLCDLEGYPTNQPQSPKAVTNVTGLLRRLGAPYSPLQLAEPVISFAGGALYLAEVVPPALGRWELSLFLGEEQIPQTANLSTFCPMGQVPMPDGDSCGCAAGTVLKPGAAALMAAGVWEADEGLCEACPVTTWSVVGADACDHCAAGYYYSEPAAKGSSPCSPCPSFAVCSPYTTLETLQLRSNMWRLTNRTLDARSCATSGDVRRSPCMGGSQSADETGSGYCAQGHEGPLCGVCTEVNHHYDVDQMTCIDCGSSLYWLEPLLKYLLPLLAIAILMAMGAGLIERRPERLRFLWKRLIKIRLLAVDANVFTRLKVRATPNRTDRVAALLIPSPSLASQLLVGFYQVCGALPKVYDVRLPPEYRSWFGWLSWIGDISLELILPVGCDKPLKPYQRLVVEGLVPVLIIIVACAYSVGVGIVRHVADRKRGAQDSTATASPSAGPESSPLMSAVVKELGESLPWLLPFSYLCSTSIATQAFNAFDCTDFEVDEKHPQASRSYLASDLRVLCDTSDPDYRSAPNEGIEPPVGLLLTRVQAPHLSQPC